MDARHIAVCDSSTHHNSARSAHLEAAAKVRTFVGVRGSQQSRPLVIRCLLLAQIAGCAPKWPRLESLTEGPCHTTCSAFFWRLIAARIRSRSDALQFLRSVLVEALGSGGFWYDFWCGV